MEVLRIFATTPAFGGRSPLSLRAFQREAWQSLKTVKKRLLHRFAPRNDSGKIVIARLPKGGVAIIPSVIARLPEGKPWQSSPLSLRGFPKESRGNHPLCHCEASRREAVAISKDSKNEIASSLRSSQ